LTNGPSSYSQVTLQDGGLRLRPAVLPEDVALGLPWYADPEVLRLSEGEDTPPYDADMVERMYRYLARHRELYVIEVREPDGWRAIGDGALCPDSIPIVIGEAAYRSHGLGTRVLSLLVRRARDLGWPKLTVKGIYTHNQRARRLFERAGFSMLGAMTDQDGHRLWQLELSLR
jgi:RimJ/RimL family protein N-acetyltransferase